MTRQNLKKHLSLILCTVLIAAMALFAAACTDKVDNPPLETPEENMIKLGEGAKSFVFQVTNSKNEVKTFKISTDKNIVGDALSELGLLSGEEGQFGLYVKTVDGETFDYDKDGKYWAFYVNGKYAPAGVDMTEINEKDIYAFKLEK